MNYQLKRNKTGFTIIEVMIVLAIAGLIMAIIFLAVPALQRNSHNNSRRSDASHLAGLVNEYAANHAGSLPTAAQLLTNCANENFAIIAANCVGTTVVAAGGTNTAGSLTNMVVYTAAKCDPVAGVVTTSGATRAFVLQYEVENSSGNGTDTCLQG